jgi:hypothetical protein
MGKGLALGKESLTGLDTAELMKNCFYWSQVTAMARRQGKVSAI